MCVYFNVCYFYSFFKCVLRHKFKFILFSMYFYTGSCNTNKIHFLIFFSMGWCKVWFRVVCETTFRKKTQTFRSCYFYRARCRGSCWTLLLLVFQLFTHTFFSSTWGSFFSCYFLLKLGSFTFKVYYFLVCVSDTNEERGDWEIGGRRIVTQSLHQICWFFFFLI